MNGGAYRDIPAVANPGVGLGTLALTSADTGVSDAVNFTIRQKGTSTTASGTFVIPEKMLPGINVGGEGRNDLGQTMVWNHGSSGNRIGNLGDYVPAGTGYTASTDGAGATVKRGPQGQFYPLNNLGLPEYRGRIERVFTASEVGVWNFALAAGVVAERGNTSGAVAWSYDSGTGFGSFTIPDSTSGYVVEIVMTPSSIPSGGVIPVILKSGVSGQFNADTLTAYAAVADALRFLDASASNNANYNNRTPLAMPVRTWTNRNRYGVFDVETQVAMANALRPYGSLGNMSYITMHIDDNTMIDGSTDYIIANLLGDCYYAFSNEICFNGQFQQTSDAFLAGVRAGFAPIGATPGTAVPETVYEGHHVNSVQPSTVQRGNWDGSTFTPTDGYSGDYCKLLIDIPAGGKLMLGIAGQQCFQTAAAAPTGTVFKMDGSGSFTVLYDSAATTRAQLRWISDRMKNLITRVKAKYSAAGKPAPHFELDGFSGAFGVSQTMLDWGNLYLEMGGGHVTPGPYFGNGQSGPDMMAYYDTSDPLWSPTVGKAKLYDVATNPTLAARITATLADYAVASAKVVASNLAMQKTFNNQLRAYNISKGQVSGWIKQGAYEWNNHAIKKGWPDDGVQAYNALTDYNVGDFAMFGGDMFRARVNPPVGTATSNTAYWDKVATAAELVNGTPSYQLFRAMILSATNAADLYNFYEGLRNIHGGPTFFYVGFGRFIADQYFGLMFGESDTGSDNLRRTSIKTVVDQIRAT
jgi:hypothetical protein